MQEAIEATIKDKKQVFLFHNRKGHSTSATCKDCGYTINCPDCHLPLVYHASNNKLICHHCRYRADLPPFCPKCSSSEIRLTGRGTQKLEREIKKLYPKTKILRLDKDVNNFQFPIFNFQIIIGTEYALSRLNWEKIGLLGIINADSGVYRPDFRASERQYQLLKKLVTSYQLLVTGQIIIQTYNPDNYVIRALAKNQPEIFYDEELKLRKALGYPPFKNVIKLIYRHSDEKKAIGESFHIYNRLKKHLLKDADRNLKLKIGNSGLEVLKPFPVFERKVRNKFQFNLIIKYNPKDDAKISAALNALVPPTFVFDRDPETLL